MRRGGVCAAVPVGYTPRMAAKVAGQYLETVAGYVYVLLDF